MSFIYLKSSFITWMVYLDGLFGPNILAPGIAGVMGSNPVRA